MRHGPWQGSSLRRSARCTCAARASPSTSSRVAPFQPPSPVRHAAPVPERASRSRASALARVFTRRPGRASGRVAPLRPPWPALPAGDRDSPSGPGVCPGDGVTSRAPWRDGSDFVRQQRRAPSASATGWAAVGPQGRRLPPIDPDRLGVGLGSDSSMAVPVWARPSHGLCFGKRRDGAATETLLRPTPCNSTTSGSPPAGRRESRGGPPRPGRCRGPWRLGSGRTSDGTPPQANPRANMAF